MTSSLFLFGPPAAGKGTQLKLMQPLLEASGLEVAVYGSGAMIREEATRPDSPWYAEAQLSASTGAFMADDRILALYRARRQPADLAIFDGLPRTPGQAERMADERADHLAIYFDIPLEVSVERMIGRGRAYDLDDQKRAARLRDHETLTVPTVSRFFPDAVFVDGTLPPQKVLGEYRSHLRAYLGMQQENAPSGN